MVVVVVEVVKTVVGGTESISHHATPRCRHWRTMWRRQYERFAPLCSQKSISAAHCRRHAARVATDLADVATGSASKMPRPARRQAVQGVGRAYDGFIASPPCG